MASARIPLDALTPYDLPPVCLVTGTDTQITFRRVRLSLGPPWGWVFLAIFVPGLLLLAVPLNLYLRQRVWAELPFSAAGWSRFRWASRLRRLGVGCLFLAVLVMGMRSDLRAGDGVFLGLIGLAATLSAAAFFGTRKWVVRPTWIDKRRIVLDFASDEAARRIRERFLEGRRRPSRTTAA